jgi:uncharacterized protein (DUF885 family)
MCKAGVFLACLLSLLVLAGCERQGAKSHPGPDGGSATEVPADANARVELAVKQNLEAELQYSPTLATWLGVHVYDDKIDDVRLDAQAREAGRLKQLIERLQGINPGELDAPRRFDRELLLRRAQNQLFDLAELRPLERNPVTYVDLAQSAIAELVKDESLPVSDRLRAITARLWKIRPLTDEARHNLRASMVPELYVRKAVELGQEARTFFAETLPRAVPVADAKLMDAFRLADGDAARALDDFVGWLQRDLQPRARGEVAIGSVRLLEKLRLAEFVEGRSAESLLQLGERELKEAKKRYDDVAKQLGAGRAGVDVLKAVEDDHGKPDELLTQAQAAVETIVRFARDGKLVPLPPGGPEGQERPRVVEMPPALWGYAQLVVPGPLDPTWRTRTAYLYIDPIDKSWPDRRKQEHLRTFNRSVMVLTLLHEVIGHFVASERDRRAPTTMQKIALAESFVEGWPDYAERMMIDQGFSPGDLHVRLVLERAILVRVARLLAVVRLHALSAKLDDVVKLFTDDVGLDDFVARREAERAALDPMVAADALGRIEIERLRGDWLAQHEGATLGQFHEALLAHGSPPVLALRRLLLNE